MADLRIERDSLGPMEVPADALYGASTARAVENFPIARRPLPPRIVHVYGALKQACAEVHAEMGTLDGRRAEAIAQAAAEVARGLHDAHFPVDVYQTGSGTSTNMNVNEVVATLANERLGLGRVTKAEGGVHPNDHVNKGQSSNDTFPTVMHVACALTLRDDLLPVLERLVTTLGERAEAAGDTVKIGRTHLMDATPLEVAHVLGAHATAVREAAGGIRRAVDRLCRDLPLGGTAVGTGLGAPPGFAARVLARLSDRFGLSLREAEDHVAAQSAKHAFVEAHGHVRTCALALAKVANDLRHLAAGPRAGPAELRLPAVQPGSSIMPGKVNPVLCESVLQVAMRVLGNDATVTLADLAGVGSIFELNTAMPVMADAFLESVALLARAVDVFEARCVRGLSVDAARCHELVERSLMVVTALVPRLGYDLCAEIADDAYRTNRTIREVVLERGLVPAEELDALLDPVRLARGGQ
ncbi:MAG: class II fumarate hydratase [Deltaproteobacteria bacterium]|nr:MAG: class II fumarate hydratase [Deltaproteobacteria bacterium]